MIKGKELKGLGGWLILVGIELIFCFIFIGSLLGNAHNSFWSVYFR